MHIGKMASMNYYKEKNERPIMHPFHFGYTVDHFFCCISQKLRQTDAIDFYTKGEDELKSKLLNSWSLAEPLKTIFVTFKTRKQAKEFEDYYNFVWLYRFIVYTHYNEKHKDLLALSFPKESSVSKQLEAHKWSVRKAPNPNNIIWENISDQKLSWWFRFAIINISLFFYLFFLTTPSIILEKLSSGTLVVPDGIQSEKKSNKTSSFGESLFVTEILPVLLLRILAATLPVVCAFTAELERYWTRSKLNLSRMIKTYICLILIALFLPMFGLNSTMEIFSWLSDDSENKWACVSDNGAFFVKFLSTCAFIGTAIDLGRFDELIFYIFRKCYSRSNHEHLAVRIVKKINIIHICF
jgi:hypothetical protein